MPLPLHPLPSSVRFLADNHSSSGPRILIPHFVSDLFKTCIILICSAWNTNIAAKTQFILAAFDSGSKGNGGSSGLLTVGESGSSACIDDSSPSSTPAGSPTASETGSATGGVKTVTAITTATGGAGYVFPVPFQNLGSDSVSACLQARL